MWIHHLRVSECPACGRALAPDVGEYGICADCLDDIFYSSTPPKGPETELAVLHYVTDRVKRLAWRINQGLPVVICEAVCKIGTQCRFYALHKYGQHRVCQLHKKEYDRERWCPQFVDSPYTGYMQDLMKAASANPQFRAALTAGRG